MPFVLPPLLPAGVNNRFLYIGVTNRSLPRSEVPVNLNVTINQQPYHISLSGVFLLSVAISVVGDVPLLPIIALPSLIKGAEHLVASAFNEAPAQYQNQIQNQNQIQINLDLEYGLPPVLPPIVAPPVVVPELPYRIRQGGVGDR